MHCAFRMSAQSRSPTASPKRRTYDGEIQSLLDQIAEAVTAGDGDSIAQLWEPPAFIIGSTMAMVIDSQSQAAQLFGGARADYHARGIIDTRADIADLEWIGSDVAVAKIRWTYLDTSGDEIGAEASDYTLRRDARGQLKIKAVLMRGTEPGRGGGSA
jgi:hypothetical protein